jgi:hypothetical protein
MEPPEIARELGLSVAVVKKDIHNALVKLRRQPELARVLCALCEINAIQENTIGGDSTDAYFEAVSSCVGADGGCASG